MGGFAKHVLAENRSERTIRLKLHGALINYGDTKEHECPVFEVVLEPGHSLWSWAGTDREPGKIIVPQWWNHAEREIKN